MPKKKTNVEAPALDAAPEAIVTEPVEAAPTDATEPRKKKAKKPANDITLEDLAAKFLQHLEDAGESNGTLFSYKLELITALDELGAKTLLADLTPTRVLEYFVSDRVTRTRAGVQKA